MNQRYNAAVLDADACFDDLNKAAAAAQLTLSMSTSAEDLLNSVVLEEPDVVVLNELPDVPGIKLTKRLREIYPAIPILILSTNPDWSLLQHDPLMDFARRPMDPDEVLHRILKLLHGAQDGGTTRYRLPKMIVEELRSDNGRLDAKLVAEMFGLSIPQLAAIIKAGEQALYKTPDSMSVQSRLLDFERIAWGLLKLSGSVKGLRIWLNAPNPEIDNDLPIEYIKEGLVEDIGTMVEDALLGHPS